MEEDSSNDGDVSNDGDISNHGDASSSEVQDVVVDEDFGGGPGRHGNHRGQEDGFVAEGLGGEEE